MGNVDRLEALMHPERGRGSDTTAVSIGVECAPGSYALDFAVADHRIARTGILRGYIENVWIGFICAVVIWRLRRGKGGGLEIFAGGKGEESGTTFAVGIEICEDTL